MRNGHKFKGKNIKQNKGCFTLKGKGHQKT